MSICIRDGCGTPFDSTEPETRATETLRAFYFRYCPKHRIRPDHESNPVITETKPTPGPWQSQPTAGHQTHGQSVVYAESDSKDIAIVYDGAANAQLIAAAPEMLEALRHAAELLEHAYALNSKVGDRLHTEHPRVWNECKAAIQKAEGR